MNFHQEINTGMQTQTEYTRKLYQFLIFLSKRQRCNATNKKNTPGNAVKLLVMIKWKIKDLINATFYNGSQLYMRI